ncbi:integrase/recombinase xerD homolog isoform X2 [Anolis sagrei]
MPSKKNVGGSKGKGPAKRAPAKRPPPTEHACEGEEAISPEALSGFRALLAAVQRGAPPAARAKTASTSNQEDILNAILSRLSAVESVVQQVAAVASHSRAEEPQVTPGAAQAEQQMTEQVVSAQPMGGTEVNPVPQQSAVSMVNPVTSSQVSTETPTTSQQEGDGSADRTLQTTRTQRRFEAGEVAGPSLADWNEELARGMGLALAPASKRAYIRTVREFSEFRNKYRLGEMVPVPPEHVIQFCILLRRSGLAPRSIQGKMSALAFWFKAQGWPDATNDFRIRKYLEGWARERGKPRDDRQPISPGILKGMLKVWPSVCSSPYEAALFHAASLTAFFGALRVSELVVGSKADKSDRALHWSDINLTPTQLQIVIRKSKTDQKAKGSVLKLSMCSDEELCPIRAMTTYVGHRGNKPGPLFIHGDGAPLTKYQFWTVTSKALEALGIKGQKFGTHSFRIGAASAAAAIGYDAAKIKALGRWKSGTYRTYVRPVTLY